DWLRTNLKRVELGIIEDGTAVGAAIASSLLRLKESKSKSKIVILLTDGVSNVNDIDPLEAAKIAHNKGIKIYTIGAGTKGYVPYPSKDIFGRDTYRKVLIDLDEVTLKKIADITEARYFRATDADSLSKVYKEIDELEKTEIEHEGYYNYTEIFDKFLLTGLLLLLIEITLRNSIYLKLP
ncbi:MAG: Ca-activated chloride channel family protein, partial [Lysobacterales bacterium]